MQNKFIEKIQKHFDIEIVEKNEPDFIENTFSTDYDGNVISLFLRELNLNDLDILLPIADSLKVLSIPECNISSIGTIGKFNQLKNLDLSKNPISNFKGIESLTKLSKLRLFGIEIDSNAIFEYIKNLEFLESLDIGANKKLTSIHGLECLKSLKSLELVGSGIKHFDDIDIMSNINYIDLTSCSSFDYSRIEALEKVVNLEKLSLFCCEITSTEGLKKLKNLKQLDCNSSQLSNLKNLGELKNLEMLDVGETYISKMQGIHELNNLKMLNFSRNNITKIEGIDNLKNLELLYLSENKINAITKDCFKAIEKECIVNLSFNDITDIEGIIPDNIKIMINLKKWNPIFSIDKYHNVDESLLSSKEKHLNYIRENPFSLSLAGASFWTRPNPNF